MTAMPPKARRGRSYFTRLLDAVMLATASGASLHYSQAQAFIHLAANAEST